MKWLVSCVTQLEKCLPTTQCHVGLYRLSNSCGRDRSELSAAARAPPLHGGLGATRRSGAVRSGAAGRRAGTELSTPQRPARIRLPSLYELQRCTQGCAPPETARRTARPAAASPPACPCPLSPPSARPWPPATPTAYSPELLEPPPAAQPREERRCPQPTGRPAVAPVAPLRFNRSPRAPRGAAPRSGAGQRAGPGAGHAGSCSPAGTAPQPYPNNEAAAGWISTFIFQIKSPRGISRKRNSSGSATVQLSVYPTVRENQKGKGELWN